MRQVKACIGGLPDPGVMEMGEASVRLREAISLDDVALVQRILKNKPNLLQNPNYEDKSNTSLHLAALHGQTEIAVSKLSFLDDTC